MNGFFGTGTTYRSTHTYTYTHMFDIEGYIFLCTFLTTLEAEKITYFETKIGKLERQEN